ncbi:hypothetical protein Lac1_11710 [Claveliimonas bilis]|uniref:Uncharacterized protein n=1 Tax=Claveliimonas bilis TaxID=3028070 RepID=A0ABM8I211_9FIRM|nr:hypothetical protein Lac1_11710 [Claveliimonas bilis]
MSGKTSCPIFTNAEINSLLGVTNSSNANTAVLFSNGDANATDAHFSSSYQSGTWYAVFDRQVTATHIRANYVIVKFA